MTKTRLLCAACIAALFAGPATAATFTLELSDFELSDTFGVEIPVSPASISFTATNDGDYPFPLDYESSPDALEVDLSDDVVTLTSGAMVASSIADELISSGFVFDYYEEVGEEYLLLMLSAVLPAEEIREIDALGVGDTFEYSGLLTLERETGNWGTGAFDYEFLGDGTVTFSGTILEATESAAVVPLPASLPLSVAGLAALGLFGRKLRSRSAGSRGIN